METAEIQEVKSEIVETTPASLIQLAIQQGVDVEKLEKLLALQERWEANKSRKDFFEALSDFQSKCPVITKNKKAGFTSKTGGQVGYAYADLAQIINQIQEPLKNCGLSYRWEFSEAEKSIIVTCIITHRNGHKETTVMSAAADTSGAKNEIQARGSTLTYLQRYTLIGALGIGTAQDDIDGQKKTDGQLHPDMVVAISDCKTQDDLKLIWEQNSELHKDQIFKKAINDKKMQLKK